MVLRLPSWPQLFTSFTWQLASATRQWRNLRVSATISWNNDTQNKRGSLDATLTQQKDRDNDWLTTKSFILTAWHWHRLMGVWVNAKKKRMVHKFHQLNLIKMNNETACFVGYDSFSVSMISDSRNLDSGFRIPDSGFRIPDTRIPDTRIPDFGIRILEIQVPDSGFLDSKQIFKNCWWHKCIPGPSPPGTPGPVHQVTGLCLGSQKKMVSTKYFRSYFYFRVPDFGFRVWARNA